MKEEVGEQQSEANGEQPTDVTPEETAVPEDGGVVNEQEGNQQVNEENSSEKEENCADKEENCVDKEESCADKEESVTVGENDNEIIKPSENSESNVTENNETSSPTENGDVDATNETSAVNETESGPANGEAPPSTNGEAVTNGENTSADKDTDAEMKPTEAEQPVNGVAIVENEADKSEIIEEPSTEDVQFPRERRLTAYERLSNDLTGDHKVQKEITLGKRIGFYRIRGELGSGNFSQVKMGIHALTKEKVAVKILDKTKLDQKTQRLLSREISSMDKMHHPNIIRLYEVVETLAKLHIVMEYAAGGELFHKISNEGKIPEPEAKIVYAQVLAAIEHMHSKNIIHRDLKAENVFYAGPHFVKVGDFGFSTCCPADQTLNTFCGSPPYAAPELFKDEHYFGAFVDIWAMGIMLYFMVCGVMPFRADTVSKLKKCILEGHYVVPNFVSDSCQFLIRGILKPIPQDRFSLSEIMRSDWVEGQEFPEELPEYNMNPSGAGEQLTEEEIEVRDILHNLGINEAHIQECHGKDSRSSINGTYRIVLHKVQRKRSGNVEMGPDFEPENVSVKRDIKKEQKNKKTSKFCVIL